MTAAKRVVVITGSAQGIGAASVKLFAEHGYAIAALDILPDESAKVSGEYLYQHCDVSDEAQVREAVAKIEGRFGTVDVLVNNAGIVLVAPLENTTWEQFQKVVNVNLGGTFLMCKYVLPIMKRNQRGSIVNLASVSGHVGQIDHAVYGSTKGGVLAFTRALAWEVAKYNIRVNSISPGSVDTPMLRSDVQTESRKTGLAYDQVKAQREAEQAFNRWADPMEIAEAVYFLASEKASFVTGADLLVDCGWVAK